MNVVQSSPSASDVVLLPGRLAVQAAKGVASVAVEVASVPGRLIGLLASAETALANLDSMSRGVEAMQEDLQGMRSSLVTVIDVLEGVNSGVDGMSGAVGGIRDSTESLDGQLGGLQESLRNIDVLAAKLTRFGGTRRARAAARELAEEAPEGA